MEQIHFSPLMDTDKNRYLLNLSVKM